jgi:SAM-dependent methyltransferase
MAEAPASITQMPSAAPHIEAETDDVNVSNSWFGDTQNSTVPLSSYIKKFREENGRTYHAYQDGKYVLPNDEREQDRLDLQHHLFTLTFDGKLFTCDVDKGEKQVHRVLDAGCGTGIWAIDFADEHPETQVLGIDLSPIQPTFIPPNATFIVDDLEQEWSFNNKFDFIYMRMLSVSILDFPALFKNSFE